MRSQRGALPDETAERDEERVVMYLALRSHGRRGLESGSTALMVPTWKKLLVAMRSEVGNLYFVWETDRGLNTKQSQYHFIRGHAPKFAMAVTTAGSIPVDRKVWHQYLPEGIGICPTTP